MTTGASYLYCGRPLNFRAAATTTVADDHNECASAGGAMYRFVCITTRDPYPEPERGPSPAGHTLTLLPPLRITSLLPLELLYRAEPARLEGRVAPGGQAALHELRVRDGVEVRVRLEGFGWSTPLSVSPGAAASYGARLRLQDARGRRLHLEARVHVRRDDALELSVAAPYWIVNRTGLPLVFRAEGAAGEAAGQDDDHEAARDVRPLPFSPAEVEAGPALQARLGRGLADGGGWCAAFPLGPGTHVRLLSARGGSVYAVGVSVLAGRGRYRRTNVVTLSPRYQLHNDTSTALRLAQKCAATTLGDPGARATHLLAAPGCHLAWHWPRWERERLLCVRPEGGTAWSGGFSLETERSLHLSVEGRILRAEVAARGAALLVVLSEAEGAPPPLRLVNRSPVALMFRQAGGREESVLGARCVLECALPEPEGPQAVSVRAPGGPRLTVQLDRPLVHRLHYQNFLYIAFTAGTHRYATIFC